MTQATKEELQDAVEILLPVLVPLARAEAEKQANGDFIRLLLELFREFLPLILEIMRKQG